jgi:hypothetical protein
VDYTDLPPAISVKARIFVHHASRWFRRTIFHIPTSRGSNYAIRKELILELFRNRRILHEIQVGPAVKSIGGKISYSGAKDLVVLTSGRFFSQGWKVLITYLIWRIRFYLRVFRMKSKSAIPPE